MQPGSHQAGVVRHVDHQQGSHFASDFGELRVIDLPGIRTGTGHDHLGLQLAGHRGNLIVIDPMVILTNTVMSHVVQLAREIQVHSVSQVPAVGQVHRQVGVTRFQFSQVDRHVGLAARVRLNVGVLGTEQLARPVPRQALDVVDVLAATVVPPPGIPLGVLVGQHAAGRLNHRSTGVVL